MLAKELFNGIQHFIAVEQPFGIDTVCGKDLPVDQYILVEGEFPNCDCVACREEIEKDLKRRPPKIKIDRKTETFKV